MQPAVSATADLDSSLETYTVLKFQEKCDKINVSELWWIY